MEQLLAKGRALYVYEQSGMYDQQEMADHPLDGVWCSIYDMLKISKNGIAEPFDQDDWDEAMAYLKASQPYTENFKDFIIDL